MDMGFGAELQGSIIRLKKIGESFRVLLHPGNKKVAEELSRKMDETNKVTFK